MGPRPPMGPAPGAALAPGGPRDPQSVGPGAQMMYARPGLAPPEPPPIGPQDPRGYASGPTPADRDESRTENSGRSDLEQRLGAHGRFGDTIVAHLNPAEVAMLLQAGGSGTINPRDRLPEFFNPGGGDSLDDGGGDSLDENTDYNARNTTGDPGFGQNAAAAAPYGTTGPDTSYGSAAAAYGMTGPDMTPVTPSAAWGGTSGPDYANAYAPAFGTTGPDTARAPASPSGFTGQPSLDGYNAPSAGWGNQPVAPLSYGTDAGYNAASQYGFPGDSQYGQVPSGGFATQYASIAAALDSQLAQAQTAMLPSRWSGMGQGLANTGSLQSGLNQSGFNTPTPGWSMQDPAQQSDQTGFNTPTPQWSTVDPAQAQQNLQTLRNAALARTAGTMPGSIGAPSAAGFTGLNVDPTVGMGFNPYSPPAGSLPGLTNPTPTAQQTGQLTGVTGAPSQYSPGFTANATPTGTGGNWQTEGYTAPPDPGFGGWQNLPGAGQGPSATPTGAMDPAQAAQYARTVAQAQIAMANAPPATSQPGLSPVQAALSQAGPDTAAAAAAPYALGNSGFPVGSMPGMNQVAAPPAPVTVGQSTQPSLNYSSGPLSDWQNSASSTMGTAPPVRGGYWSTDSMGNPVPVDASGNAIQNYQGAGPGGRPYQRPSYNGASTPTPTASIPGWGAAPAAPAAPPQPQVNMGYPGLAAAGLAPYQGAMPGMGQLSINDTVSARVPGMPPASVTGQVSSPYGTITPAMAQYGPQLTSQPSGAFNLQGVAQPTAGVTVPRGIDYQNPLARIGYAMPATPAAAATAQAAPPSDVRDLPAGQWGAGAAPPAPNVSIPADTRADIKALFSETGVEPTEANIQQQYRIMQQTDRLGTLPPPVAARSVPATAWSDVALTPPALQTIPGSAAPTYGLTPQGMMTGGLIPTAPVQMVKVHPDPTPVPASLFSPTPTSASTTLTPARLTPSTMDALYGSRSLMQSDTLGWRGEGPAPPPPGSDPNPPAPGQPPEPGPMPLTPPPAPAPAPPAPTSPAPTPGPPGQPPAPTAQAPARPYTPTPASAYGPDYGPVTVPTAYAPTMPGNAFTVLGDALKGYAAGMRGGTYTPTSWGSRGGQPIITPQQMAQAIAQRQGPGPSPLKLNPDGSYPMSATQAQIQAYQNWLAQGGTPALAMQ